MRKILLFIMAMVAYISVNAEPVKPVPAYSELVADNETVFYLYNVDKGAFLLGANDWNTRASLSEEKGYQFKVRDNGEGRYSLIDFVENQNAWKSMFVENPSSMWVDNNNGANADNWTITALEGNTYQIGNTGVEGLLGTGNNLSSDSRLYMVAEGNATTWAFISEADYTQYKEDAAEYIVWQKIESAKPYVTAMAAELAATNVYTAEAMAAFQEKVPVNAWMAAIEDGSFSAENAEAAIKAYNANFAVTGWRAATDIDDLLTSAWEGADGNFGGKYYINTWSTEGNNDGSNFKVPFFEYWTGDYKSLDEKTMTATATGLIPGKSYEVSAWARVRTQDGAAAPAYGITFQVGDSEAVDACAGEQVGNSQFYLTKLTATGKADAEGNLTISFSVATDNNVSWLSWKNVYCSTIKPLYTIKAKTVAAQQYGEEFPSITPIGSKVSIEVYPLEEDEVMGVEVNPIIIRNAFGVNGCDLAANAWLDEDYDDGTCMIYGFKQLGVEANSESSDEDDDFGFFGTTVTPSEEIGELAIQMGQGVLSKEEGYLTLVVQKTADPETTYAEQITWINFAEGVPYEISNVDAGLNLTIEADNITIQPGSWVYFTEVEDGYALSNSEGLYIKKGGNNWVLTTTTELSEAYTINPEKVEGGFKLTEAVASFGLDGTAAGEKVWGDKKTADKHIVWTITPVVKGRYTVVANLSKGGVNYGGEAYAAGAELVDENLDVEALTVIPVEGYNDAQIAINGSVIVVTYNRLVKLAENSIITIGEKANGIVATTDPDDNSHWYIMTQNRGGESPLYYGDELKRAAAEVTPESLTGQTVAEAGQYLVRFLSTEEEGIYNIQFVNGKYIAGAADDVANSTHPTTSDVAGNFAIYQVNAEDNDGTHYGWNTNSKAGKAVDNNGAGSFLSYWGAGEKTAIGGNNDWAIYEVSLESEAEVVLLYTKQGVVGNGIDSNCPFDNTAVTVEAYSDQTIIIRGWDGTEGSDLKIYYQGVETNEEVVTRITGLEQYLNGEVVSEYIEDDEDPDLSYITLLPQSEKYPAAGILIATDMTGIMLGEGEEEGMGQISLYGQWLVIEGESDDDVDPGYNMPEPIEMAYVITWPGEPVEKALYIVRDITVGACTNEGWEDENYYTQEAKVTVKGLTDDSFTICGFDGTEGHDLTIVFDENDNVVSVNGTTEDYTSWIGNFCFYVGEGYSYASGDANEGYALLYCYIGETSGYYYICWEDGADSITSVKVENTNNAIFNLNGVRLSKPMKGINIINGKKVIIK